MSFIDPQTDPCLQQVKLLNHKMCPCSIPVSRQECSSGSGCRMSSCGPAAMATTDSDLNQLEVVVIQLGPELDQNFRPSINNVSISSRRLPSKMLLIHVALVVSQFGYAGNQILARIVLVGGVNQFLYSIYRNLVGFGILAPAAYILERNVRPKMTIPMFLTFNLLAFTGILGNQQLFLAGLSLTSPLFAAVSQNMIPVFTFLLAVLIGVEEICFRRRDGIVKILGTIICVSGAVTMSAYKGMVVYQQGGEVNLPPGLQGYTQPFKHLAGYGLHSSILQFQIGNYQLGGLCLVLNCISWAVYLILQAPVLRTYPALLTVTSYTQLFGIIQVALFAMAFKGKFYFADFKLKSRLEVLSIIFAGIVPSCINLVLQAWCAQNAGAFIVSLYNPFQMLIVAFLAILLLRDPLYLGLVVGGALTVGGFYLVVYGQFLELRRKSSYTYARTIEEIKPLEKSELAADHHNMGSTLHSDHHADDLTTPLLTS